MPQKLKAKFTARKPKAKAAPVAPLQAPAKKAGQAPGKQKELGGPSGPEPTRYGDWERKGICVDF